MNDDLQYDLSVLDGLSPAEMLLKIRKDLEFAMPPKGLTTSICSMGGIKWTRQVWRCPNEGCWYVATPSSMENLSEIQRVHASGAGNSNPCPSPPRREELPSGLAEIEKLWREIDDATDAILLGKEYRNMNADSLRGYLKGLSFSIVMKDGHLFENITAVAKEAKDRWKMRRGHMPWRATPTGQAQRWTGMDPAGGWKPAGSVNKESTPVKKTASRKITLPAKTISAIKSALSSGIFSPEDLATMYSQPLTVIKAIQKSV